MRRFKTKRRKRGHTFGSPFRSVIPNTALDDYDTLLRDFGYEKEFEQDVSNEYDGRMIQYTKPVGENEVKFEALIDAMGCQQTDAEWSYRDFHEHSTIESLDIAEDLDGRIPEPAFLFAMKLHSGRRADIRDLVVISVRADFNRIERHVHRSDPEKFASQIKIVLKQLGQDGFKGVFQQEALPTNAVDNLVSFLSGQRDQQ